jgi:hypothetical protein
METAAWQHSELEEVADNGDRAVKSVITRRRHTAFCIVEDTARQHLQQMKGAQNSRALPPSRSVMHQLAHTAAAAALNHHRLEK